MPISDTTATRFNDDAEVNNAAINKTKQRQAVVKDEAEEIICEGVTKPSVGSFFRCAGGEEKNIAEAQQIEVIFLFYTQLHLYGFTRSVA